MEGADSIAVDASEGRLPAIDSAPALEAFAPRWHRRTTRAGLWPTLVVTGLLATPTAALVTLATDLEGVKLLAFTLTTTIVWYLVVQRTTASVSSRGFDPLIAAPIGAALGLAGLLFVDLLMLDVPVPPRVLLFLAAITFVLIVAFLAIAPHALTRPLRVMLVGVDGSGVDRLAKVGNRATGTFECVGLVSDRQDADPPAGLPSLGVTRDLVRIVERERPDLIVCAPTRRTRAVNRLLDAGITWARVVDLIEFEERALHRVATERLRPNWFTGVLEVNRGRYASAAKRCFDVIVACVALVLTLPLLAVIAIAIRAADGGPALLRQIRTGEGGRLFVMLKFRSMVLDAERHAAVWAAVNDPRVTPVGRVLRRTRLDELPQLWNVLRGEMSIVGPRPERPEYLDALQAAIPFWSRRHLLRPGMTGWAQLHHGYTADVSSAATKLSYDLYYLKHRSFSLDFLIVLATLRLLFSGHGAR